MVQPVRRAVRPAPASSGSDVFQVLAGELLRGRYPAGSRLPPERALAAQLRTSRSTLREALRKLESLGLVRARRGSGLEVQDLMRRGSIGLLSAWIRAGAPGVAPAILLEELLRLRRVLLVVVVGLACRYAPRDGIDRARAKLDEAWALRDDPPSFVRADFELTHAIVSASGFLPAAWLLNALEEPYFEIAAALTPGLRAPRDYHRSWSTALAAIAARREPRASAIVEQYLERHDARLRRALGAA